MGMNLPGQPIDGVPRQVECGDWEAAGVELVGGEGEPELGDVPQRVAGEVERLEAGEGAEGGVRGRGGQRPDSGVGEAERGQGREAGKGRGGDLLEIRILDY